ncbi:MAG: lantibiotic dehydratase, partial [Bacteroidetes bacterium]|nr:lantibiotic dehydratase [Bacteroidota bacterium]
MDFYLQSPLFRSAIYLASPDLYAVLEKTGFDWKRLTEKARASVWKYANRMQYRPTPFGICAAFSVVQWKEQHPMLQLAPHCSFHVRRDFKASQDWAQNHGDANVQPDLRYMINPTLYPVMDSLRYLTYELNEKGNRSFVISEADLTPIVQDLLSFCRQPLPFHEIAGRLCAVHAFTGETASAYLNEMIQSGILVPDTRQQLNITGEDYYLRATQQQPIQINQ